MAYPRPFPKLRVYTPVGDAAMKKINRQDAKSAKRRKRKRKVIRIEPYPAV
jgi:hypothetical protein